MNIVTSNNKVKNVTFYILFFVSTIFSIMLFISLVNSFTQKLLLALFAFGFELLKIFTFVYSKSYFREKKKILFGFFFFVYLGMAIISSVASAGFSINSIKNKANIFSAEYEKKKYYNEKITQINAAISKISSYDNYNINDILSQINLAKTDMKRYYSIYTTTKDTNVYRVYKKKYLNEKWRKYSLSKKYATLTKTDKDNKKLNKLLHDKDLIQSNLINISTTTADDGEKIFTLLGSIIHVSGERFLSILMLMFTIFLELGIAVTSVDLDKEQDKYDIVANNSDKELILRYVTELFNTKGKRLVNNKNISEKSGISLKKCNEIKEFLKTFEYKNEKLIWVQRGGTFSKYTKERVHDVLNEAFKNVNETIRI